MLPDYPSRPASVNAFAGGKQLNSSESHRALHDGIASAGMLSDRNVQNMVGLQNKASQTFASVLASSLSKKTTPDPQQLARTPSPSLQKVGARLGVDDDIMGNGSHSYNDATSSVVESDDLVSALSGMRLATSVEEIDNISLPRHQRDIDAQHNFFLNSRSVQNRVMQSPFSDSLEAGYSSVSSIPIAAKSSYLDSSNSNILLADFSNSALRSNVQTELHSRAYSSDSYLKASSGRSVTGPRGSSADYLNADNTCAAVTSYGLNGHPVNPAVPQMLVSQIGLGNLPPLFENAAATSAFAALGMDSGALSGGFSPRQSLNGLSELQSPSRIGNHSAATAAAAAALQMQLVDPQYIQYLKTAEYASQAAANLSDPSMGNSYLDLLSMQEAYLGGLLQHQKQYGSPFLSKTGPSSPGYYGNTAFGMNMSYPGSSLASPILASQIGSGSPVRHAERNMHFHPGLSNLAGGIMGSWSTSPNGNLDDCFPSTLLEEFKSSKTRCFELSDIASHVVEFRYVSMYASLNYTVLTCFCVVGNTHQHYTSVLCYKLNNEEVKTPLMNCHYYRFCYQMILSPKKRKSG